MLESDLSTRLPTSDELPDSDDTPVDNENQNFLPNLLLFLLKQIWQDREDWFFAADLGIYYTPGGPYIPIIPDGFLSLGVERHKNQKLRKSYVLWEENYIVPILAIEIVSWSLGGEYTDKMAIYAKLGILYYVIYNPEYWKRDRHSPFEVYRLVDGAYQLQTGEPFWMSEIGLGIGRDVYQDGEMSMEALYWYDEKGDRYLTAEEKASKLEKQLERYRQLFGDLPDS